MLYLQFWDDFHIWREKEHLKKISKSWCYVSIILLHQKLSVPWNCLKNINNQYDIFRYQHFLTLLFLMIWIKSMQYTLFEKHLLPSQFG